jgi:predicted transcriptional regulator
MVNNDIFRKRLNWRVIIIEIRDYGYSIYEIAKRLGKPESTVRSWMEGHEPSHSHGQAILEFHIKCFGEEATKNRCNEESVYVEEK